MDVSIDWDTADNITKHTLAHAINSLTDEINYLGSRPTSTPAQEEDLKDALLFKLYLTKALEYFSTEEERERLLK